MVVVAVVVIVVKKKNVFQDLTKLGKIVEPSIQHKEQSTKVEKHIVNTKCHPKIDQVYGG